MTSLWTTEQLAKRFLETLPSVRAAFGYGSGVFRQPGRRPERWDASTAPQLDFIFAVDDPAHWHKEVYRPPPCVSKTDDAFGV